MMKPIVLSVFIDEQKQAPEERAAEYDHHPIIMCLDQRTKAPCNRWKQLFSD
ncbi:MAG: hypothetical protein OSA80_00360 [Porticoccaceae bacterium]|jgi:hypothetical protein|nr:hypothetical protein [Porticoccaceae bacterium]